MATTHASSHGHSHARREIALVLGLTAVAAAIRVWRLGELPPGLHVDEAYNILDARAVLAGWRPVFLPANAGREALYTYLQAPLLAMLGESPATARLASAIAGVLAVPATWWFARGLPFARPARVAVLSCAFVTFSYWHLHFSRFGIRAVLFPLVVALTLGVWWRLIEAVDEDARRPRRWAAVAALGLLLGAAAYIHPAGRALIAIPALDSAARWLRWRDARPARRVVAASAVAVFVALPLGLFWARNPALFASHAGEVTILRQGPTAVAENALRVAGMFNVAGDPAGWRNLIDRPLLEPLVAGSDDPVATRLPVTLRGRPVFDLVSGILFLAGLAMTAAAALGLPRAAARRATEEHARRTVASATLVIIGLAALLLPSVLTDAAPNFSRAIGAIPLVCLLPACSLDAAAERARARWGRAAAAATVAVALAIACFSTLHAYFVLWAASPSTPFSFDADKVALARYLDDAVAEGRSVYVSTSTADHPTVRASSSVAPRGFDPTAGFVLPSSHPEQAEYVFLEEERDLFSKATLVTTLARSGIRPTVRPLLLPMSPSPGGGARGSTPPMAVLQSLVIEPDGDAGPGPWQRIAAGAAKAPMATFGSVSSHSGPAMDGAIALEHWDVAPDRVRPGQSITLTLLWRSLRPAARDLTAFVHLVDADGSGVAGADAPPLGGTYPTTRWQPGEWIANDYVLTVPTQAPAGAYEVLVGWYDAETGERLPVTGRPAGIREDGTAYAIGPIPIAGD